MAVVPVNHLIRFMLWFSMQVTLKLVKSVDFNLKHTWKENKGYGCNRTGFETVCYSFSNKPKCRIDKTLARVNRLKLTGTNFSMVF